MKTAPSEKHNEICALKIKTAPPQLNMRCHSSICAIITINLCHKWVLVGFRGQRLARR